MEHPLLTKGFCEASMNDKMLRLPVLRVEHKGIEKGTTTVDIGVEQKKNKLLLCDGSGSQITGLLSSRANKVMGDIIEPGMLVRLKEYMNIKLNGQRCIIITELDFVKAQEEHTSTEKDQPKAPTSKTDSLLESAAAAVPIAGLAPRQRCLLLCATVVQKGDIRQFNSSRGKGQLFTALLQDTRGDIIRGTFFNEAANEFFPILEEGKRYTMANGYVKEPKRQYAKDTTTNLEINFALDAIITKAEEDGFGEKKQSVEDTKWSSGDTKVAVSPPSAPTKGKKGKAFQKKKPITLPGNYKLTLNVGGKKFATCVDTLSKESNKIHRDIAEGSATREADGSYFFDRDPLLFKYVLAYLRTGRVSAHQLLFASTLSVYNLTEEARSAFLLGLIESLLMEASYFQLDQFEKQLRHIAAGVPFSSGGIGGDEENTNKADK